MKNTDEPKKESANLAKMREQAEAVRRQGEISFAKQAPEIQKQLKFIKTPLTFHEVVHIYRWICRKQITIEMLPKPVFDEFKETKHYELILQKESEKLMPIGSIRKGRFIFWDDIPKKQIEGMGNTKYTCPIIGDRSVMHYHDYENFYDNWIIGKSAIHLD